MLGLIRNYTQSGDKWEELINRCYRIRYQKEGFQEIPANYKGDGGIEGFTNSGIVYQCYCPEKAYSDDELHNHLRDKMHKDISKFINPEYEKVLKGMGIHDVCEWHLVIPEYKDKRILSYKTTQEKRVLDYKQEHPKQCDYIADNFKIYIKVAEDFMDEINRIIRNGESCCVGLELSDKNIIDWGKCESDKSNNIKRKIKAVMNGVDDNDQDYQDMVGEFLESYMLSIVHMDEIRREDIVLYEQFLKLKQSYKKRVEIKTKIRSDHSMNREVFFEIMDEFKGRLNNEFNFLTEESRDELLYDTLGEWLADCPMQFKL